MVTSPVAPTTILLGTQSVSVKEAEKEGVGDGDADWERRGLRD